MRVIGNFAEMFACGVQVFVVMWCLLAHYQKKSSFCKKEILIWFLMINIISFQVILFNPIQSIIIMIMETLFACRICEGKIAGKIVIVIGVNISMILLSMFGKRIAFLLFDDTMRNISLQGSGSMARIFSLFAESILNILAAYIITNVLSFRTRLKKEEFFIISIFYGLFFGIAVLSVEIMVDNALDSKWQVAFLTIDILMFAANIAVLHLIRHINIQNVYELENNMLKLEMKQQEEHIRTMEKNYYEIRTMRHDMKRYFVTYLRLLKDGKYDIVEQDMEHILGKKLQAERYWYTENSIINAVINEKVGRCKEHNIAFKVHIAADEGKESMNMGIILSNLLDNAIEAEQKEKEKDRSMELYIQKEGDSMHIIVRNFISKSVLAGNPSLKTTKKDVDIHGIGLNGVREFVRRMNGKIEILEENNWFVVHICIVM